MSSVMSRVMRRRSSRVNGVRSSASCSVTARRTCSCRSSVFSRLNSSGPRRAMHSWWMRVFSSAYGSPPTRSSGSATATGENASATEPLCLFSRSCRPMSRRLREQPALARALLRLGGGDHLTPLLEPRREIGAGIGDHDGRAAVHGGRTRAVARHLEADLPLERRLDLALLHTDLRVGAVED